MTGLERFGGNRSWPKTGTISEFALRNSRKTRKSLSGQPGAYQVRVQSVSAVPSRVNLLGMIITVSDVVDQVLDLGRSSAARQNVRV
jgi:hypothetical protein